MDDVVRSDWYRSEHTRGSISVLQGDQEMNKLTALSKLASAWHYLMEQDAIDESLDLIGKHFHYIRRSLRLADLKPLPKDTEGYNGRGPSHF